MVEKPADDLTGLGVEWVSDTIDRWIEANEVAQQIQRSMPLYVHERLSLLPEGHDALPMAMAFSMRPDAIREAHEWLVSARAQVQVVARLSHPDGRMGAGPSDEKTGQAEVDERGELELRVERLEARMERVEMLAEEVSSLAAELQRLHGARRAN